LRPDISDALAAARRAGAEHALLCGSGPTVVGLFGEPGAAQAAAVMLSEREPRPLAVEPWGSPAS
jgi:4-diphosphocytidyl-2C-methyl-D-erythritol kinase